MKMGGNSRIGRLATWLLRGGTVGLFVAFSVWLGGVCLANEGKTGLETPHSAKSGLLTYYTTKSCQAEGTSGVWTASGLPYDESALTVALPHHRFGGRYRLCRESRSKGIRQESRCVEALHTDYGPGRRARARGVIADASPALYDALGCKRGVTRRGVAWGECQVRMAQVE